MQHGDPVLETGISKDIKMYIVELLKKIKENRNGYSHKDNLHDYRVVEESRNNAYLLFYLLLGSHVIPNINDLQIETKDTHTSFYKICEYTQFNCMSIYQITKNGKELGLFARKPDDDIKYDSDGNVHYSKLVFSNINTKEVISFKEADLENISIREGELKFTKKEIAIVLKKEEILKNGNYID